MKKEEALDVYLRARSKTEKSYDLAAISTDGPVNFDFQDELNKNIINIDSDKNIFYDFKEVLQLILPEPNNREYDLSLINGLIGLNLPIEDTLDEISHIYDRSLQMLGMKKSNNNLVWAKVRLHGTNHVFEIGVK